MPITYDTGSANTLGANSTTVTTASITTTEDGELLISFFFGADNTSASLFTAATSPNNQSAAAGGAHIPNPNFWGEVADSTTTLGADTGNAFAHAVKVTAGATGTLQTTAGNSSRHGLIVGAFKLPAADITLALSGSSTTSSDGAVLNTSSLPATGAEVAAEAGTTATASAVAATGAEVAVEAGTTVTELAFSATGAEVSVESGTILAYVFVRYGRPSSDLSAGAWTPSTGSDLYAMLDEETANDTDYIETTTASTCEVALNAVTDPATSSGQVVTVRAQSANGNDLVATLMQGATTIATRTFTSLGASWADYTITLTGGECDAITDYADLSVTLEAQ
jgi:hypothetical protein